MRMMRRSIAVRMELKPEKRELERRFNGQGDGKLGTAIRSFG
jgi:hypothetical protein